MTKQEHETKMLELYKKALEAKDFQIAFQVEAPCVIDASQRLGVAAVLRAQQRAAVRAAIHHGVQPAFAIARHDDGRLADAGDDVIAMLAEFLHQAQIMPHRSLEDFLLFLPVLVRVGEQAVGNAAALVGRPFDHSLRNPHVTAGTLIFSPI